MSEREALKRLADSEARRAELEAVIEKVRDQVKAGVGNIGDDFDDYSMSGLWVYQMLSESPYVVLGDRDRRTAARTLEDVADQWHEPHDPTTYAASDWLTERAAAIRKGDN